MVRTSWKIHDNSVTTKVLGAVFTVPRNEYGKDLMNTEKIFIEELGDEYYCLTQEEADELMACSNILEFMNELSNARHKETKDKITDITSRVNAIKADLDAAKSTIAFYESEYRRLATQYIALMMMYQKFNQCENKN